LVELPPATQPEAVLLAQNLPNLIWLADSGVVHAGPTRDCLQTLRDARCNLVGSVVNHAPGGLKNRFSRWTTAVAAAFLLCAGLDELNAQNQGAAPANPAFGVPASAGQPSAPAPQAGDQIEQAR